MKIDRPLLDKVANLARLEINEQESEKLMSDMTLILNWVEKLNEVNTTGVEPLTSMNHEVNALREDEQKSHLNKESALHNAPKKDLDYFRVPKVLE